MASGWVARSWRRSSPWLVIALMVILPLVALYFFVLEPEYRGASHWGDQCTLRLPFKGIIAVSCAKLRVASFAVSAAGAFAVIMIAWWLLNEAIGLRRIFEVPWFGVGEDVENVGVIESIVRAGIFVVVVWIALSLCALAVAGMYSEKVGEGRNQGQPSTQTKTDTSSSSTVGLTPMVAAAERLAGEVKGIREQLAGGSPPSADDARVVSQLQRIGEVLHDIQATLKGQDEKLGTLRLIADRLKHLDEMRNDAALLTEARHISGTLGEIRTALDAQGRRLAALDDIARILRDLGTKAVPAVADKVGDLIGAVGEVRNSEREQTSVLERIEQRLRQLQPVVISDPPPERGPTSCLAPVRAASTVATPRRYRRMLRVFFDKAAPEVTPGGRASLLELADELNRVDEPAVLIFGSADLQGDPVLNTRYAEERAQSVRKFLEAKVPQLRVETTSKRSTEDPPSEPYNRIARVEAQGLCR